MTLFFYILIGIITFLAFLHACFKKDYDISRTIIINRSKANVFAFVRQLKKQPLWMPWFKENQETIFKFKGEDGHIGASLYWKGKVATGEGTQEIIKIKEGKLMESKLFFVGPFKMLVLSYVAVKEIDTEKTKLVLGIRGKHRFPTSLISIFYSPERIFGKELETALQNLKKALETEKK